MRGFLQYFLYIYIHMSEAYVVLIISDDEHACLGDMQAQRRSGWKSVQFTDLVTRLPVVHSPEDAKAPLRKYNIYFL